MDNRYYPKGNKNENQEEDTEISDRRNNRFRFDKSVNIPGIVSSLILLWTLITGMNRVYSEVQKNYTRTNIMWNHFVREHKDLTQEELANASEPGR